MSGWPRLDECDACGQPGWCYRSPDGSPECAGCRAEAFFERIFRPLGFTLLKWQREIVRGIYGPVDYSTGRRQIEQAYVEVPKKNGKSFLLGGFPLFHLAEEVDAGEVENAEAYGAAAAKGQASIVFRASCRLIRANPFLRDIFKVLDSTKRILRKDDGGSYTVLSADGDLQDGAEPSLVLIDEVHRWKTPKALILHEVLIAGTISRPNSLAVEITTAGEEYESPLCWRAHERARQHIRGVACSERLFAVIHGLNPARLKDDPAYWCIREARAAANPSHEDNGGFLQDGKIAGMLEELGEASYKRYHLNIWGQKENRAIDIAEWDACNADLGALVDRPCFLGLDLSSTIDLTALVALFPPFGESDFWDVLPYFWIPQENMLERERRDRVPYRSWAEQGRLTASEGNVIDYRAVREKVAWCREVFDVQTLGYDPWHATQVTLEMIDDGLHCEPVRQGYKTLSEPTKKLLELIKGCKIRHAGHPVLRWNADCLALKFDNDNIRPVKPDRKTSNKRIDGIAALINALTCALTTEQMPEAGVRFL